ncbi:ferrous iron transport protein B [Aureispira anguillae]|uniref:Ferrous iron transport protein B n=1 Tax=Aureispira anguillae TaxID=2864201 RepID=A0A916DUH8_9BACT|nr:ferrous iron transport protein B [Aureispira anguillae]BDS13371.1 ferrous iron transport protein B [Aureispira anguillae]
MMITTKELQIQNIALLGNPNAGKSSLFNALTGLNQKVGNYSGVTIDKNTGTWKWKNGKDIELFDLPGIYSLFAKSPDERVVLDPLLNLNSKDRPDLILVVLDASNLSRSLLLLDQIRAFNFPLLVVLNMIDVATDRGIVIDVAALEKKLGLPVVPINARLEQGIKNLENAISTIQAPEIKPPSPLDAPWERELSTQIDIQHSLHAKLLASQYPYLSFLSEKEKTFISKLLDKHQPDLLTLQTQDSKQRLAQLEQLTQEVATAPKTTTTLTERLDKILLHNVWGYVVFFALLLLVFQAIFNLAGPPMDFIDESFANLTGWLSGVLPESLLSNLLTDGIIAGIGGIVIFIPQIAILFALISILDETGYMARVMFLTDKTMSRFGLNGKSIVPLISGAACAVPAVMATRNITSWKERLTTIMVTPLMSCSARLPVYIIFITLVVPSGIAFGPFGLQSLVLAGLYLGGFLAALISAWFFNKILKTEQEEKAFFVMELPSYKLPQWKSIGITIYQKTSEFVFEAGKIIIAISIILWVLATYGPPKAMQQAEQTAIELYQNNPSLANSEAELIASKQLEASFIGQIGHFIEPAIRPLGYDWKIGIALITSFAAREVFVSTMATIYSVGDGEDSEGTLLEKLRTEENPQTGKPVFTTAVSFSLLIFYLFAMQCMATLAIVQRETKSWKWPLIQLLYMTVLAYFGALLTYQLLS